MYNLTTMMTFIDLFKYLDYGLHLYLTKQLVDEDYDIEEIAIYPPSCIATYEYSELPF